MRFLPAALVAIVWCDTSNKTLELKSFATLIYHSNRAMSRIISNFWRIFAEKVKRRIFSQYLWESLLWALARESKKPAFEPETAADKVNEDLANSELDEILPRVDYQRLMQQ